MANEIVLKENELTDIAQRAIALDASMSNINTKLQKLYSQLDADIVMIQNAGAHITYGLPEISKNIRKQSEDMTNISRIMSTAGEKAVTTNRTIIGEVEGVKAMSLSMGTVIAASSVTATLGAIISNIFGVNVGGGSTVISNVANGINNIFNTIKDKAQDLVDGKRLDDILEQNPNAKVYYNELLAKGYTEDAIYSMIKDNPENAYGILSAETDRLQKQEMQDRYNRLVAGNNGNGFYGKCGVYTYRQLADKGIASNGEGVALGKDYYSTWTNRGKTKTGYLVESHGGNGGLDALVAAHDGEAISNVVVSFNQYSNIYPSSAGHVLLIDKIVDGKVYFSENADGSLWSLPGKRKYKAGEPICLTIEEFKKQYPKMNGVVHFYK